jgi:hypothetical protein
MLAGVAKANQQPNQARRALTNARGELFGTVGELRWQRKIEEFGEPAER